MQIYSAHTVLRRRLLPQIGSATERRLSGDEPIIAKQLASGYRELVEFEFSGKAASQTKFASKIKF